MRPLVFLRDVCHEYLLYRAVYTWVNGVASTETKYFYTKLTHLERSITLSGDTQKTASPLHNEEDRDCRLTGVVLCLADQFPKTLKEFEFSAEANEQKAWYPIFRSHTVEVWVCTHDKYGEEKGREVDPAQKMALSSFVRSVLTSTRGDTFDAIRVRWEHVYGPFAPPRWWSHTYSAVDVVLWVRGEIRGSRIERSTNLLHALYDATMKMREDVRFRPLGVDEYNDARIEINMIGTLRIPLFKGKDDDFIEITKTYVLTHGEQEGFFVPAVFNIRSFRTLRELLTVLRTEKLGTGDRKRSERAFLCETNSWVEGQKQGVVHDLSGPLVVHREVPHTREGDTERVCRVVRHLASLQNNDGSFKTSVSVCQTDFAHNDLIRNAHVVYALSLILDTFGDRDVHREGVSVCDRGYRFLTTQLDTNASLSSYARYGALVYLWAAAIIRGDTDEVAQCSNSIVPFIQTCPYDPILLVQVAKNHRASLQGVESASVAKNLILRVIEDVRKKSETGEDIDIGAYSGLLSFSEDTQYGRTVDMLKNTIAELQHKDGSFPQSVKRKTPHTRGTAKILESFSEAGESRTSSLFVRALSWLESMQYREESLYCVPSAQSSLVLSGFRHNAHMQRVWIDTSAHYLLALAHTYKNTITH